MTLMRSRRVSAAALTTVVLGLPLLGGCGGTSVGAPAAGRPSVVTSIYPLQFVAERVVGDHATVEDLTHPGQEPHDIELDARQVASVADADVVLYESGFQQPVDQAVEQDGPQHVVDASRSGQVRGRDPHFWQDPYRLRRVTAAFTAEMAAVDPRHAFVYRRNGGQLERQLADLDRAYRKGLRHCRLHTIVVSHDAFAYLGRRYGLRVLGINGISPEAEPSPWHVRQLQDTVRRLGITTIYGEPLDSSSIAASVAHDLDRSVTDLDAIEGLTTATAHDNYLTLMRANLQTLRKGNECR